MSSIAMSSIYPAITVDFVYDITKPTYWQEKLAYYELKERGALAVAGATISVEETTPADQQQLATDYAAQFGAWIADCQEKLSAYLVEAEGARSPLVLLSPPAISAATAAAVVLYRGAVVKMGSDVIANVVKTWVEYQAATRGVRLERMLDKAFFRNSYFGLVKSPYLDDIQGWLDWLAYSVDEINQKMSGYDKDGNSVGIATVLSSMLSGEYPDAPGSEEMVKRNIVDMVSKLFEKPEYIRLLLKAVISNGYNIDEIDFDMATDEG